MLREKKIIIGLIVFCCCVIFSMPVMAKEAMKIDLTDGEYAIDVEIEGGSGKASVETPTLLIVEDGKAYVQLVWSSSNYDYMIVDDVRYENQAEENMNSKFRIPVLQMDQDVPVIADTTAMGTPHEIKYALRIYSDSIGGKDTLPQEAAKKMIWISLAIIVFGGILNYIVKHRNQV